MERREACNVLLELIASVYLDKTISKALIKARDIYVCSPNKVLDVLATDQSREVARQNLNDILKILIDTGLLDLEYRKKLVDIMTNPFSDRCSKEYLPTRCANCPNLKIK